MMRIPCSWCGPRDADEFAYLGEAVARPDPRTATPAEWRSYLYLRANVAGWVSESWYHRMGCRRYLSVRRNTVTNEVTELPSTADRVTGAVADRVTGAPARWAAGEPASEPASGTASGGEPG